MRKTRIALLAALALTLGVVVAGYYVTQKRNLLLAPARPAPLPKELGSAANNWSWSQSVKDRSVVEARARDFRQIKDSSRFELGEVELKIFSRDGETYDWVRSRQAEFDQPGERLYSEGEVVITLRLPARREPDPAQRFVVIRTSGLSYDNKTGVCSTGRPAHFQFQDGEGRSTGAVYDSANRYLWMKRDVEIAGSSAPAMRI
ncbi:MAG: LPS export ABC transporter periplasmic protein LptC, partial [Candidatus Methylomirabilaceae bacterium]